LNPIHFVNHFFSPSDSSDSSHFPLHSHTLLLFILHFFSLLSLYILHPLSQGTSGVGYYTDAVLIKKQKKLDLKNGKTEEKNTMSNGDKNEDKKKKKEEKKKDRRLSGSYPPANSVRVDDLTPLDGEEGEGEGEVR
jgi:hypothetical protein